MTNGKKTGGRQPGSKNKTTVELKDAIMGAFHEVGGRQYLVRVAEDNPAIFCTLLGRILPKEVHAQVNLVDQYYDKLVQAEANVIEGEARELKLLQGGKGD